jgi:hypothetical protein
MFKNHDLALLVRSHIPIIIIESHEERRILDLLCELAIELNKPIFHWTITQGLQRADVDYPPQKHNSEPDEVLKHIKASQQNAIYVMADFHPYMNDPVNVRLLKDIALDFSVYQTTLILISHKLDVPGEIQKFSAR